MDLTVPSPSASLYYCNLLDALAEEYDVVLRRSRSSSNTPGWNVARSASSGAIKR